MGRVSGRERAGAAPAGDGRDRRWEDHRHERRELLLASAVALIDRDGTDVGVATIAAGADIPRSVVYKLFRDREDLDDQIRARIIEQISAVLTPSLRPQGTVRESVRRGVDSYVRWVGRHANLHRFLGSGSASRPSHGSQVATGGKLAFAQSIQQVLETQLPLTLGGRPGPPGAADNLAYGIVGLTDGVVNRWLVAAPSARSSARDLSAFLCDAICSLIQTTVAMAGGEIDLDAPLSPPTGSGR